MKTMDSIANDDSTDDLTATNTFSTASFNSFDQIETLKIIRSKEVRTENRLHVLILSNSLNLLMH